jgi:hypothetical protein
VRWHPQVLAHQKQWARHLYPLLVELEKGPILLSPLSLDELIVIVADSSSNIGKIRYDLKKNKDRIIAAL